MRNFYKILGWFAISVFVLVEIAFVFVLPNVIDLNDYKPELQKIAKDEGMIDLDFDNAKVITTPLFSVGAQIDGLKVKLSDNSDVFSADKIKARVALPSLLLLTVKLSCLEIENPNVNLEIAKNDFKLLSLIKDVINKQKNTLQTEKPKEEISLPLGIKPEWIRIKVPNAKLKNYNVIAKDLETSHYLNLKGEELRLGYFNGKTAKIKTKGGLYSDENENISLNINIDTSLPAIGTKLDEEDDKAERIDIPFFNPVEAYRTYDLKANIDSSLRVRVYKNRSITSFGHFNIENLTLKISDLQLPESYFRVNIIGQKADIDTNIQLKTDEKINLSGKINYSNTPKADLKIKTDNIYFNDLLELARAVLDSFNIRHELGNYSAEGYFSADTNFKTNFKKLKSTGHINISNGALNIKEIGNIVSDARVNINLDNNELKVKDSALILGGAKIWADGGINEKSYIDLDIISQPISLPVLYNAFAPKEIKNSFNLFSGKFKLDLNVKGKLHQAYLTTKFALENLKISDKTNFFSVNNGGLYGDLKINPKDIISANLVNKDFAFYLPKSKSQISAKYAQIDVDENDINIAENAISINNKSVINYRGKITNYLNPKNIEMSADGNIFANDLVQFIGAEFAPYLHANGTIPVKVNVTGDNIKQTLVAKVISDSKNFITPIDFNELQNKVLCWQSIIDFKHNHLKIKETGVFERTISHDKDGKEIENLKPIIETEGTLVNTRINMLRIHLHNALSGKIFAFPKSSLTIKELKTFIFGQTYEPRFIGDFAIENLSVPELFLTVGKVSSKLTGQKADWYLDNINVNGSDFEIDGILSLVLSDIINIPMMNVSSKNLDVDKLLKVSDAAMKYVPKSTSSSSAASADIPVIIHKGRLNIQKIKTGSIKVEDVFSDISLKNNIFYLTGLKAKIFSGKVNGDISMNLISTLLMAKVNGSGINMEQMLYEAANMKDTLSGKTSFEADVSLKGATYEEQVKSLKGTLKFFVKDGNFGPFGKIENMILAENIRESEFFKNALGGVVERLSTIDTAHFLNLAGKLSFKDGICDIEEITSEGRVIAMHIFGKFDILGNTADMKVRAQMTSVLNNLLGPIAMINPVNLVNSAASVNVVTAKAFSLFCETVTPEEAATIPSFGNKYVDNSAMKFQLGISGDVAKPLSLIKSFKWLSTPAEFNLAKNFVASIPDAPEGSTATTIEEVIEENKALEAEKKTFKYKIMHIFSKKEKVKDTTPENKEDVEEAESEETEIEN